MALPYQPNKTHLRDELRARLGFASQTASTIQNKLMESWLDRAQEFIYDQYRPQDMRVIDDTIDTVQGTTLYDWPDQINYREFYVEGVYCKINASQWIPLSHGIRWPHDNVTLSGQQSFPERFDTGPQLELWPEPDGAYDIRIEGFKRPGKFRADLTAWAADTATTLGDIVIPTSPTSWPTPARDKDHFYYEATAVAGDTKTHATDEPTWPTTAGDTVVDDQVTWTAVLNTCTVDAALVLELALAWGKSHYRQADAEIAMNTVMQRLEKLKSKQHGKRRYVRGTKYDGYQAFPSVSDPFSRS